MAVYLAPFGCVVREGNILFPWFHFMLLYAEWVEMVPHGFPTPYGVGKFSFGGVF